VQFHVGLNGVHLFRHLETDGEDVKYFRETAAHPVVDVAKEFLLAELLHLRVAIKVRGFAFR